MRLLWFLVVTLCFIVGEGAIRSNEVERRALEPEVALLVLVRPSEEQTVCDMYEETVLSFQEALISSGIRVGFTGCCKVFSNNCIHGRPPSATGMTIIAFGLLSSMLAVPSRSCATQAPASSVFGRTELSQLPPLSFPGDKEGEMAMNDYIQRSLMAEISPTLWRCGWLDRSRTVLMQMESLPEVKEGVEWPPSGLWVRTGYVRLLRSAKWLWDYTMHNVDVLQVPAPLGGGIDPSRISFNPLPPGPRALAWDDGRTSTTRGSMGLPPLDVHRGELIDPSGIVWKVHPKIAARSTHCANSPTEQPVVLFWGSLTMHRSGILNGIVNDFAPGHVPSLADGLVEERGRNGFSVSHLVAVRDFTQEWNESFMSTVAAGVPRKEVASHCVISRLLMMKETDGDGFRSFQTWSGAPLWDEARKAFAVLVPKVFGYLGEAKHTRLLPLLRNGILALVEATRDSHPDLTWLHPNDDVPCVLVFETVQELRALIYRASTNPEWAQAIRQRGKQCAEERWEEAKDVTRRNIQQVFAENSNVM